LTRRHACRSAPAHHVDLSSAPSVALTFSRRVLRCSLVWRAESAATRDRLVWRETRSSRWLALIRQGAELVADVVEDQFVYALGLLEFGEVPGVLQQHGFDRRDALLCPRDGCDRVVNGLVLAFD
jgi:hypothetical protein